MAHRKILEITFKVVVDVENDDLPERKADPDYIAGIEGRIEEFIDELDGVKLSTDTNDVKVVSTAIDSWDVMM